MTIIVTPVSASSDQEFYAKNLLGDITAQARKGELTIPYVDMAESALVHLGCVETVDQAVSLVSAAITRGEKQRTDKSDRFDFRGIFDRASAMVIMARRPSGLAYA